MCIKGTLATYQEFIYHTIFVNLTFRSRFAEYFQHALLLVFPYVPHSAYLLIILLWTIFKIIIRSAQSFRNSDIRCFKTGFISCFAIALR